MTNDSNISLKTENSIPLCDPGVGKLCCLSHTEHFPSSLCNHCSVVNAEP